VIYLLPFHIRFKRDFLVKYLINQENQLKEVLGKKLSFNLMAEF